MTKAMGRKYDEKIKAANVTLMRIMSLMALLSICHS